MARLNRRAFPSAMKVFHYGHWEQLVFFESSDYLSCEHALAFLPDLAAIGSLDPAEDGTLCCPALAARILRVHGHHRPDLEYPNEASETPGDDTQLSRRRLVYAG